MLRISRPSRCAPQRGGRFFYRLVIVAASLALGVVAPVQCRADNRYWITTAGGTFGVPGFANSNWSLSDGGTGGATVPFTGDHARFTRGSDYTITFGVPVTNQQLSVTQAIVTFDLNTRTYQLTNNNPAVTIGEDTLLQTAHLKVQNGTLDVNDSGDVISVGGLSTASFGNLTVTAGGRIGDGASNPAIRMGDTGPGFLTVEVDGQVNANSIQIGELSPASATVTGPLAAMHVNGATRVSSDLAGSVLNVVLGAEVTSGSMKLGDLDSESGAAAVSGADSTISIGGELVVGAAGDGTLSVESGGVVTAGSASYVGHLGDSHGDVTITGAGSALNIAGDLAIAGSATSAGGTGTLNIENNGTAGLTGTLRIWPGGTVNIDDGTLRLSAFDFRGGDVNFNAGTITYNSDKTFASTELTMLLGADKTLRSGRTLSVAGTAFVQGPLVVDGGTFAVGTLVNLGGLVLRSGNLNITGVAGIGLDAAGLPTLPVPFGARLNVTNNISLFDGAHLIVQGGEVMAGQVTILIGGRITLDGATSRLATSGTLTNRGVLSGNGIVAARLHNHADGEVRPAGGAGLLFTGLSNLNHGEINLAGGAVEFTASLTNSATGFIGGRGTLITGTGTNGGSLDNEGTLAFSGGFADVYGDVINDLGARIVTSGGGVATFYDDVTHRGTEIRTASGSRSVFFGAVTGAGPFTGMGTVQMEGDLRPGNSAALVTFGGDLHFGSQATLDIEIGGLAAGSEFDALDIAGEALLDGSLDVSLSGGLVPALGNSFEVLRADGGIFGTFAGTSLPVLPAGLDWNVVYSNFAVLLQVNAAGLPGDFNQSGTVDMADYVVWRKSDGSQVGYDRWRTNFGRTAGGASVVNWVVPEPTAFAVIISAFLTVHRRWSRGINRLTYGAIRDN
jgi:T5SS/PEP-CTERM-associated repeat protein